MAPSTLFFLSNKMKPRSVTRRIAQTVLVLFFLRLIISSFTVRGVQTGLQLDPQSSVVWGVDEAYSVKVTVMGGVGICGWQIRLYYDSHILNGTTAVEGSFLKVHGATFFNAVLDDNYDATHGCVTALCSLLGNVSGVGGNGVLLTVTFRSKAAGISLLQLRNTTLGDINGISLPHDAWDGAVQVFETYHDVALVSAGFSPLQAAEGRLVNVTVVARNLGNRTESFNVVVHANDTAIASQPVTSLPPGTSSTLTYVWNTSGTVTGENYLIWAEAIAVPGETNLDDNVLTAGILRIVPATHNVAVKRISLSRTQVYQGQTVDVTVTVANKGDYTETFNVTAYYDDVAFASKAVNGLLPGSEEPLGFQWNTAGLASDISYVMKAAADPVPGETVLADNTFADGNVTVLPRSMLSINIISVVPSNQAGDPVSSFTRGTVASFKITINSNSLQPETVLLTASVYDQAQVAIGVISFKGLIAPGTTVFVLGSPLPRTAHTGTAVVYVDALTDWVHAIPPGTSYCPEVSASFTITGA